MTLLPSRCSITLGSGERSNSKGIQEKTGQSRQICFDLNSCIEQGIGPDGLIGPFQLNCSMILHVRNKAGARAVEIPVGSAAPSDCFIVFHRKAGSLQ